MSKIIFIFTCIMQESIFAQISKVKFIENYNKRIIQNDLQVMYLIKFIGDSNTRIKNSITTMNVIFNFY
jgi:hypothetical protein